MFIEGDKQLSHIARISTKGDSAVNYVRINFGKMVG
jgi:hypothetical protein